MTVGLVVRVPIRFVGACFLGLHSADIQKRCSSDSFSEEK